MENDRAGKVKKKKKEAEDMEQELLQEIASYWGTRAEGILRSMKKNWREAREKRGCMY